MVERSKAGVLMIPIEQGIVTYLKARNVAGGRIYPVNIPQTPANTPLITYQRISTVQDYAHSGPTNIEVVRVQFNVIATKYSDAKSMAEDLKTALDGYSGAMGAVNVGVVFKANELDDRDPEADLYRVIIDMIIRRQ